MLGPKGFLASAIKRAYGIKDFDSIIPGHGGVMDRFDCQFLMALCTWVHYNTFVKLATVSVPRLTYLYSLLGEQEKKEFLKSISHAKAKIRWEDFA
jgi:phosphatidate cytidylyltransferase